MDSSTNFKKLLSPANSYAKLKILRILAFISQSLILIQLFIYNADKAHVLIYYTNWGAFMAEITYGIFLISVFLPDEEILYKIAYFCFEITWVSQVVITVFFWGVLSWNMKFKEEASLVWTVLSELHTFPIIVLSIDFIMNRVYFPMKHLIYCCIPPFFYMTVSIILSYGWNIVAYPMLTWKELFSIPVAIVLLGLFIGGFFIGYHLTRNRRPIYNPESMIIKEPLQ